MSFDELRKKLLAKKKDRLYARMLADLAELTGQHIKELDDHLVKGLNDIFADLGKSKDADLKITKLLHDLETKYNDLVVKSDRWDNTVVNEKLREVYTTLKQIPMEIKLPDVKFPDEIGVKKPVWWKQFEFNYTDFFNRLRTLLETFMSSTFRVRASAHEIPDNPIYVRLVDDKGRPVKVPFIVEQLTGGSSGGGGGYNYTALRTDAIYHGAQALDVKYAFGNIAAGSTDSSLVSAVAGKRIRVISFRMHAGATATNVTFNSKGSGAGTAISELFACAANGGRAEGFNPVGHCQTNVGEALTITTGAGSTVGVGIVYVEIPQ